MSLDRKPPQNEELKNASLTNASCKNWDTQKISQQWCMESEGVKVRILKHLKMSCHPGDIFFAEFGGTLGSTWIRG